MSQKFKSDIEVQEGLRDSSGSLGTAGQVLSTTGTSVAWINENQVAHTISNQVKAGVAINKGQAVYATGADGTNIIVGLASNAAEATSSKTLGLLDATVSANGFANVVENGKLDGLNTLGASAGDPVWLGVNGGLIYGLANKPYAPANLVFIGIVTRVNANNGEIFVNVQNGFELNEIHDVDLKTNVPVNGNVLGFNGTLWVNRTIAQWLGYTPANANGTTNYVSKFTGSTTLGNSQIFDNGTNVGINTTSPTEKLHVIGNTLNETGFITARNLSTTNQFRIDPMDVVGPKLKLGTVADPVAFLEFGAYNTRNNIDNKARDLQIFGNGITGVMLKATTGNLGIGTTAPAAELHVMKTNAPTSLFIGNSATNRTYGILKTSADTNGYLEISSVRNSGSVWGDIILNPSGGNVGIGITSASERLHVNGRLRLNTIDNGVGDFATISGIGVITRRTAAQTLSDIGAQAALTNPVTGTGANQRVALWSGTTTLTSDADLVFDGTNLGVGTTTPAAPGGYSTVTLNGTGGSFTEYRQSESALFRVGADGSRPFLYGMTDAPMDFFTNTSLKMRITSAGNVGIGTTNPSYQLDVANSGRFGGLLISNDRLWLNGNTVISDWISSGLSSGYSQANSYGWINGAGNLVLGTNGSEQMRITSSGNVGIGTTSPQSALSIGTNHGTLISIGQPLWANNIVLRTGWDGSDFTQLQVPANGANSANITLRNSGNVGIGTTSPSSILHLSSSVPFLSIQGSTTGSLRGINIMQGSTVFSSLSAEASLGETRLSAGFSGWGGFQTFYTNGSEKMRILAGGNVGIGTTNPEVSLDVVGINGGTAQSRVRSTSGGDIRMSVDTVGRLGTYSNSDLLMLTNGSERMRITSGGNVGIRTTNPVRELQVGGFSGSPEICIGSGTSGNGTIAFGDGASGNDPWRGFVQYQHSTDRMVLGTANAGWLTLTNGGALGLNIVPTNTAGRFEASNDIVAFSSSDKNWKKNIKNIDSPLEKLSKINGVEFDWIEDEPVHGNKGNDIGVIAQEIEQVLPQIVQTRESGMKAVQYDKIIPLLIESIKEQQKQIEELKQIFRNL